MMDFFNKTIQNVYNSFSTKEKRPNINFIKITELNMGIDNITNISIILYINERINIYLLQTDPIIELKLIFSQSFPLEKYKFIDSVNYITKFNNEMPLILLINKNPENILNSNYIKFYSIINKKVIHTINFKYKIKTYSFKEKYFCIGCKNGKIYVYNNKDLNLNFKITKKYIKNLLNNNIKLNSNQTTNQEKSNLNIEKKNESINLLKKNNNDINNLKKNKEQISSKYLENYYIPIFDLSDNSLIYFINNKEKKKNNETNNSTSSIQNIANETIKNFSKLKEWSFKSVKNYNQLRKSTTITSNLETISNKNSEKIYVSIFIFPEENNENLIINPEKITVPFFNEVISYIKIIKNGKYIIIGNKNNHLFFIYELFPQTNYKYKINNPLKYKIIYSLFRGISSCQLNAFDVSNDLKYSVITSNRGTNHLFYLPPRDNQIIENIDDNSNNNNFDEDYLNMKIINGEEINKDKYNYYNSANHALYDSKIILIDKIFLEHNLSNENINKLKQITDDKFLNQISNKYFLLSLNDNILYINMIYNNKTIIPFKKIKINLENDDKEIILQNYNLIKKNFFYNINPNRTKIVNKKQINNLNFLLESTKLSNFSNFFKNPLFTFNIFKNKNNIIYSNNLVIENVIQLYYFSNNENKQIIIINCNNKQNKESLLLSNFNNIEEVNSINEEENEDDKDEEILFYKNLCNEDEYFSIKNSISNIRKTDNFNESTYSKKLLIFPKYTDSTLSVDVRNDFYDNKNNILENNIKNAIETNINDINNEKNNINEN